MVFKRNLRYGMSGSDVRHVKTLLHALGFYTPDIISIKNDRFGRDTQRAVLAFQTANADNNGRRLTRDGIVGSKTWNALARVSLTTEARPVGVAIPVNIGAVAAKAIAADLATANKTRQEFVQTALSYAYDPAVRAPFPHSLYIYGVNLFSAALTQEIITPARIRAGAKRTPEYYSGGRMDMMLAALQVNPSVSGADCSGGIVGIMRKMQLVKPSFDTTANLLASNTHSSAVAKSAMLPGDWVGRSGHIGIYAGGGYVVEWMGGAYGCQLNRLDARAGYDFVAGRIRSAAAWTRFRRPKYY